MNTYEARKTHNDLNKDRPFIVVVIYPNGCAMPMRGDYATLEAAEKKAAKLSKAK